MFFGAFSSALVFPFFDVFCVPEWGAADFSDWWGSAFVVGVFNPGGDTDVAVGGAFFGAPYLAASKPVVDVVKTLGAVEVCHGGGSGCLSSVLRCWRGCVVDVDSAYQWWHG